MPHHLLGLLQELLEGVLKKVSTWDRAEKDVQAAEYDALAAETSPGTAQGLSMEEQLAQKRQIFAPQEAYKMLARELKDMMLEPSNGVIVDAIGNSVWHWDMKLTEFDSSTPISEVTAGCKGRHAHHYICCLFTLSMQAALAAALSP